MKRILKIQKILLKFRKNRQNKEQKSKEFQLKKISVLEVKHYIRSSKSLSPLVDKEIVPKKNYSENIGPFSL